LSFDQPWTLFQRNAISKQRKWKKETKREYFLGESRGEIILSGRGVGKGEAEVGEAFPWGRRIPPYLNSKEINIQHG